MVIPMIYFSFLLQQKRNEQLDFLSRENKSSARVLLLYLCVTMYARLSTPALLSWSCAPLFIKLLKTIRLTVSKPGERWEGNAQGPTIFRVPDQFSLEIIRYFRDPWLLCPWARNCYQFLSAGLTISWRNCTKKNLKHFFVFLTFDL